MCTVSFYGWPEKKNAFSRTGNVRQYIRCTVFHTFVTVMAGLTRERYRQWRGGMYTFVKVVMTSLNIKEREGRKVFHLRTLSIEKIL